jgi:hypothetical protein
MKSRLGDEMTVVRTDLEWFGPSLPHLTMFAVLKYFRVSNRWIDFFRRVIEAPIKFLADGRGCSCHDPKARSSHQWTHEGYVGRDCLVLFGFRIQSVD